MCLIDHKTERYQYFANRLGISVFVIVWFLVSYVVNGGVCSRVRLLGACFGCLLWVDHKTTPDSCVCMACLFGEICLIHTT